MKKVYLFLLLLCIGTTTVLAQELDKNVEERLKDFFANYTTVSANIGKCKLKSIDIDHNKKKLSVNADESFAYQPFRPETVEGIYRQIGQILPGPVNYYELTVFVNGKPIEELIPNFYRSKKKDKSRLANVNYKGEPWTKNISRPYEALHGLEGRHISLWQSHGKYYKNDKKEWKWQRPPLYCTTEDLYTQSYIIPYIIPMLENAGAVVFTPRERDTQRNEVIVDNDNHRSTSIYLDKDSKKGKWKTPDANGFAQTRKIYLEGQNPFTDGTVRYAKTEKKKFKAFAEWIPDIPQKGKYAVYVSYRSLPESVTDAKYTVFHKGGATEVKVNQQIGGGTWVYLGTFPFDKGSNEYGMVVLSNESKQKGVVCADAVRFGGGMGNIARHNPGEKTAVLSGLPRYLEAARYSAQWAGMDYAIYGGKQGSNDYTDDINTRSLMINYLSGGSVYNPASEGLGIPFEMNMALHSDAGVSKEDKIIGTLGIYTSEYNEGKLNSGISRYASRDLSDMLLTGLQQDIRSQFPVEWNRRSMWDRNYSETRLPAVPSTILELLSHQNFADMILGHDPNFRFAVGRSIYKSILRFINTQHGQDYIVQPLPVSHFAIQFGKKKNTVQLTWKGEEDPLEPTAKPQSYIVYTRLGYGGFDNGVLVNTPSYTAKIEPGLVYSFQIAAVNKGGESFPSEILSAYIAPKSKGTVLIVNGFDRLSAPAIINTPDSAGFDLNRDPGVAYLYNIAYCGAQTGFDRRNAGIETEGGLGFSGNELEGMRIAGNTFDYPFVHGKAIQASGNYSFVSCSDEAVESGRIRLGDYPIVDLILGLEKENDPEQIFSNTNYKTFTPVMQQLINTYCQSGGNILVSGSYVGSDMMHSPAEQLFTRDVLKYEQAGTMHHSSAGQISGVGRVFEIPRTVNENSYSVPSPDCITPVEPAFSVFAYADGNQSAGIAYNGNYRTFVLGFPFESITSEKERAQVMAAILRFFETTKDNSIP